jgi:hypothetical protein
VPGEHRGSSPGSGAAAPARILFIYNADTGILAAMLDSLRKLARSPEACALCSITHGIAAKRNEWDRIECQFGLPTSYYHRDELPAGSTRFLEQEKLALPVVLFEREDGGFQLAVTAGQLRECRGSPVCLKARIEEALGYFASR